MKRVPISEISLVNRKEPRIALPCLFKPSDSALGRRGGGGGASATHMDDTASARSSAADASVLAVAVADAAVDVDDSITIGPVVVEPEPAPVVEPMVRAAALLNKLVDKRDLQGTLCKCAELIGDDGTGFVVVALSLRSLRTRDQRHVIGQLLAHLVAQQLLTPANIVDAFNQVLSSRTVRLILRGYAELLAPLFIDDDHRRRRPDGESCVDADDTGGGGGTQMTVLGVLTALDCLSVKQLERLHDAISMRLRDLVGAARARLLLPPAIDWATFKEQQSESLPLNEAVRERKQYIKILARCRERDCSYSSTSVNNLRHHLAGVHQIDLPESRLRFATEQEFFAWKMQLERADGVRFVADHLSNYMCSWRGVDPSRRARGGATPGAGDCFGEPLHGLVCTSGLSVRQHTTGELEVTAFLTHYHQQPLLAYNVLDQRYLHDVSAGAGDASTDVVLAANSATGGGAGGDTHLNDVVFIEGGLEALDQHVTATACDGAATAGGVEAVGGGGNDGESVTTVSSDAIIDDMRRGFAMFENPGCYGDMNVVLYKEPQVPIPNSDVWQLNDFALSMASDEQLRRLSHHGGNVLCLSGAEDTPEGAVFHLISISVVDELLDGWPVVWMLSNRCDEHIVAELIKHVGAAMEEKRLVFRAPLVLLSDSTALHRGWCAATDTDSPLFVCPWHVQLAWESALPLIQADERADQVRGELLSLLRCQTTAASSGGGGGSSTTSSSSPSASLVTASTTAASNVQRIRELTLELLKDPATQTFGKYFRDHWLQRQHQWAGAELAALVSHADLVVRGLQRSTEDLTVGRTNNTSIAGCVEELLEYLNQRVRDSRRKCNTLNEDGGGGGATDVSAFTDDALRRHNEAVLAAAGGGVEVVAVQDGSSTSLAPRTWEVRCADQPHLPATVEQWTDSGRCQLERPCRLQCAACPAPADGSGGVCLHQYSCSCPATSPCATVCRHIHLVALYRSGRLPTPTAATADACDQIVDAVDNDETGALLLHAHMTTNDAPTAANVDVDTQSSSHQQTQQEEAENGPAGAVVTHAVVNGSGDGGDPSMPTVVIDDAEQNVEDDSGAALVEISAVSEHGETAAADGAADERPASTTTQAEQPASSATLNCSEQRVEVANGLLALAVEVDGVHERHLGEWSECVQRMRATLPPRGTSRDSPQSDNQLQHAEQH